MKKKRNELCHARVLSIYHLHNLYRHLPHTQKKQNLIKQKKTVISWYNWQANKQENLKYENKSIDIVWIAKCTFFLSWWCVKLKKLVKENNFSFLCKTVYHHIMCICYFAFIPTIIRQLILNEITNQQDFLHARKKEISIGLIVN